MKKTVLCHFWNEEFMLSRWLIHHREIFDHGIMIDYQSTDRSVEMIRDLCPTWEIRPSRNTDFGAMNVDLEVEDIEREVDGWRVCLNVTEHLWGDIGLLDRTDKEQLMLPAYMFVSKFYEGCITETPLTMYPFHVFETTGYAPQERFERALRSIHRIPVSYPKPGRHYFDQSQMQADLVIFHYGWAPMCDELLNRKVQIQERIPEYDRTNRLGWHHITNREALLNKWENEYKPGMRDLTSEITRYFYKTKEYINAKQSAGIMGR